jgi:hypothetical protein
LYFVRQLYNVNFTRSIFKYLEDFYKSDALPVDSLFKSYKKIKTTCGIQENVLNKTKINEKLLEHFTYQNDGMGSVDTIKTILNRFISHTNNKE